MSMEQHPTETPDLTISLRVAQKLNRMGLPQKQTQLMWSKWQRATVYDRVPQGFGVVTVDAWTIEELEALAGHFSIRVPERNPDRFVEELILQLKRTKRSLKGIRVDFERSLNSSATNAPGTQILLDL